MGGRNWSCDGVKVRLRGTAFHEFPVAGIKPSPRCAGLRLELGAGGKGGESKQRGARVTRKQRLTTEERLRLDHGRWGQR